MRMGFAFALPTLRSLNFKVGGTPLATMYEEWWVSASLLPTLRLLNRPYFKNLAGLAQKFWKL